MITLDQFVLNNNGKQVEVAGSSNAMYQCVDLVNAYIRDVLGLLPLEHTNAQDFPANIGKNYDFIKNTVSNFPLKGDIPVWKSPDNIGHIDICIDDKATVDSFKGFDQNWSKKQVCTIENHVYTGNGYSVMGWLRCKIKPVIISEPDMTDDQKRALTIIEQFKTETGKGNLEGAAAAAVGAAKDLDGKNAEIGTLNDRVSNLETNINELNSKIIELQAVIDQNLKSVKQWQTDVATANELAKQATEQLGAKTNEVSKYRGLYEKYNEMPGWDLIKLGFSRVKAEIAKLKVKK